MRHIEGYATTMRAVGMLMEHLQEDPEVLLEVQDVYAEDRLIDLYPTLGHDIRRDFKLWEPRHPVNLCWRNSGSKMDSPFHPDEYSMELLQLACITLFGPRDKLLERA